MIGRAIALRALILWGTALPALAQQATTGAPSSPSAATTIDSRYPTPPKHTPEDARRLAAGNRAAQDAN